MEWDKRPALDSYPAKIAAAIVAVKKELGTLPKSARNKFANYDYTPVDDFYSALRPLMAKAGLFVIPNEAGWDIRDITATRDGAEVTRSTLFIYFDFWFGHESGEVTPWPIRRTVSVASMGPQDWGQAQSYAEKQFLRAQFLAATGDPEADAGASPPPVEIEALPAAESAALADDFINTVSTLDNVNVIEKAFTEFRQGTGRRLTNADKARCMRAYQGALERVAEPQEETNAVTE